MLSLRAAAFRVDALLADAPPKGAKRPYESIEASITNEYSNDSKRTKYSESRKTFSVHSESQKNSDSASVVESADKNSETSKLITNEDLSKPASIKELSSQVVEERSKPKADELNLDERKEQPKLITAPEWFDSQALSKISKSLYRSFDGRLPGSGVQIGTGYLFASKNINIPGKLYSQTLSIKNQIEKEDVLSKRFSSTQTSFPAVSTSEFGHERHVGSHFSWEPPNYWSPSWLARGRGKLPGPALPIARGTPVEKEGSRPILTPFGAKPREASTERQKLLTHSDVTVALQHHALWEEFHQNQTEMIITKNGRRMFPVIKIRVFGLNPDFLYMIYLDLSPVDGKRYRYAYPSSTWVVSGTGDASIKNQVYIHPDSPATGRQWMEMLLISFDKLKLTNNRDQEAKGQIFLQSMQKYRPRIFIQCLGDHKNYKVTSKISLEVGLTKMVNKEQSLKFSFPETSFITVTAYQNQKITRLKINSNPFAKGFRDNSKYKETMERHLMTSVSCSMGCQHSPYFPFNPVSTLSPSLFVPPFPFNPFLPLSSATHLRPAASQNRWSTLIPSEKPPESISPSFYPFNSPSISKHSDAIKVDQLIKYSITD